MKIPLIYIAVLTALSLSTPLARGAEAGTAGMIDFGKFIPSSAGGQFVEVNLKGNLLAMAAQFAQREAPEVADLLRGLQMIRVNVIGLKDDNRDEVRDRIAAIRGELDRQGWERIVTAQQDQEDVGVYLKTRGQEAVEGLVVTVLSKDREAVLINIVGEINPEKLSLLGERLNIEPLKKAGEAIKKS
jgi:hypothetical protein